jgi:hypothetical protein
MATVQREKNFNVMQPVFPIFDFLGINLQIE